MKNTMMIVCLWMTCVLISCTNPEQGPDRVEILEINDGSDLTWWQPEPGQSWQIQYAGDIDLDVEAEIYDLDLFETTPEIIDFLHSQDKKVVCYLNAGAWEDWRPDRDNFPDELLGKDYQGWQGEKWLDIRRIDLLEPLIASRLDLCTQKGFDGVDPDNLDGYTNKTGFPLTPADQIKYNRWLAEQAHARNLAVGLKNDPEQAAALVDFFDWITTESCFHEGWCEQVLVFLTHRKPIIAIEYSDNRTSFQSICAQDLAQFINPILKHRQLDAWRETCHD